jgi:hypothetical protein
MRWGECSAAAGNGELDGVGGSALLGWKMSVISAIKAAATSKDDALTDGELDTVHSSDWTSWTRLLTLPVPYPSAQGSRR